MKLRLSVLVAAMLLLAGCLSGDPAPEAPQDDGDSLGAGGDDDAGDSDDAASPPAGPALADLTCDFTYPDNETAIDCANEFTETAVAATEQPGFLDSQWLCVHHAEASVVHPVPYWIHWHPLEGAHGVYYEVEDAAGPVNGLFYTDDGTVRIAWYDGGPSGFIPLPLLIEDFGTFSFTIRIYTNDYSSDTSALADGTLRAHWSIYDDRPYPVQVLSAGSATYHFNEVNVGSDFNFPYSLKSFSLQGEDFGLNVTAQHLLSRTDAFTNYPLHQCSL